MHTRSAHTPGRPLALLAAAALFAACEEPAPVAPDLEFAPLEQRAAEDNAALATLRRATARYHDLDAAVADGFVFLHGCEVRPDEGPAGILYVHLDRLLDGAIDPALPDGLLYAPSRNGKPKLAGVELAVFQSQWAGQDPPEFLGTSFQTEEEFGAFGLHIWVWSHNPEGMFAQAHPGIECGPEA